MDQLQATPRRFPMVGGLADFLAAGTSPQRTQQMRGLMEFLQVPDIAATLDRVSYGEPLTTGAGMTTRLRPEAENTLMAALGMIPAGRPAEAGAMALGRAGERVAERVVPQVMSRGGLPAEMLSAMAQGTQSPATVYHGTPHRFTKFDSSKIGTGEGNQTYGYGLYLAENPEVAQSYKQALSEPELFLRCRQVATQAGTPMDTAKAWLQDVYDRGFFSSNTANPFDQAIKDVQAAPVPKKDDVIAALNKMKQKNVSMKPSGNLMQVDLPDEQIAKMLDFDKPLSQQAPEVQKALAGMGYKVDKKEVDAYSDSLLDALMSDAPATLGKQPLDMSGESIYRQLTKNASNINTLTKQRDSLVGKYQKGNMSMADAVRAMNAEDRAQFSRIADQIDNTKNSAAVVSEALRQAGIPGIRYLDEGSRSNFRVQNTVKGKPYGEPVSFMTERQAQEYAKEQAAKGFGTQTLPGTSNFVVFPGMEDMLRIEQIINQPVESLFRSLGR